MKQIAVVGCGGMIGQVICRNLCNDFRVKGGQRHEPAELLKLNNFTWQYLDLFQEKSLEEFCQGSDVVINCAGPEFIIKDTVAQSAMKAGAKYVDVSNAMLVAKEHNKEIASQGVSYIGAGFYPGVTGLLVNRVLKYLLDEVSTVNCYIGGAERYTKTSISDIVMSGHNGIGKTDSYWKNEKYEVENMSILKKEFVPEVDSPVYKKPYLSQEVIDIVKNNQVPELHWYNIVSDDYILHLAMDFYQLQMESSAEEALKKLNINIGEAPKEEWVAFVIDATGVRNGNHVKCRVSVQMENSSELTGTVAAEVARRAINDNREKGIYWAHEILPADFMKQYQFSKETDFYEEKYLKL